jgi:hypothetical protein
MLHPTVSQREKQVISIDASQDEEQNTETFTEDLLEPLEKRVGAGGQQVPGHRIKHGHSQL